MAAQAYAFALNRNPPSIMKPVYLFLLLLLAGLRLGWAQVPGIAWQRAYGTATRDERGGIAVPVLGPTGGLLIAGQQLVPGSAAISQVYLARTNNQGDTLWTRRFVPPLSRAPQPTGLAIDRQGNVLLTVSSIYSATTSSFSHLIKFNPTCDTVRWQQLFQPVLQPGTGGQSNLSSPFIAPDGNYLFLREDATNTGQTFAFRAKLIKVNAATGNELWNFDFNQYAIAAGFGIDIFISPPAQYPGGVMVHLDMYNPTTTTGAREYLFISHSGSVDRFKRRPVTSFPSDNYPVCQTTRDGNVLVGRRQKLYKISTAPATAGDTLWRTVAPLASNAREWDARDMVEDQDGNILLVGDSYFSPPGLPPTSRQIHLVRFTGRGVLVQDTILRRVGDNFARSAILGPTGRDLIFSGYATVGILGGEDLLMARYTGYRPLATAPGVAARGPRLTLYPNPAGGSAPVWAELPDRRGGTLRVFDALGRPVAQQTVEAGRTAAAVSVADLPPGVYVLRFAPAGAGPPSTAQLVRE